MANTSSKTGNLEPIMLLKVGIPLALSAACGIMIARSSFPSSLKSKPIKNKNFHSQNHSAPHSLEEEEISVTEEQKDPNVEEVILSLKNRVEDLERKEFDIEKQFIWYQNLKERESLLMELKNTLVLDMAHISFLEREILLMEEENKRFESLVSEYLGVSEQLEGQKTENKLLEREVKKLKKRLKEQSKIIREKNLKIEDCKTELWRNNEEMETKKKMLEKLGNEVREMKMQMEQLQDEQENKASSSSTFKNEEEKSVTMEDFNKLSNEFSQLKEAFEVLRKHEETEQSQKENHEEAERKHKSLDQKDSSSDKTNSTRPKLLQRMGCVGGNDQKMKRKIRPE